ncbi:hypothetical protein TBK1r_75690 [Stieleria magnilauensis]|uniref:Uncharacterized protein n=1 Tax=Stieleria magnilauensis TaxID=2527963 RepID=A0ABX5Y3Z8_9BACT|nr:hypothetical protein TBK1r_75690 [Planctomycetes bacterium TBK1r]
MKPGRTRTEPGHEPESGFGTITRTDPFIKKGPGPGCCCYPSESGRSGFLVRVRRS